MELNMGSSWNEHLKSEFSKDYFRQLLNFLDQQKMKGEVIFPPTDKIFAAFKYTPFDSVKVVILGQDPYHGDGQANGLSFSVSKGLRKPPSLLNIFKELNRDVGMPIPENGNLESWAKQGVLLLNAILTVGANNPGSHQKKGWEQFTDAVIQELNSNGNGIIFILWGLYAKSKIAMIDTTKHFILEAAHPSPLARTGFAGCKHFSKANEILLSINKSPIDWSRDLS